MDNAREELEALTQSEGWKLFVAQTVSEWGPGGRAFIDATTKAANGTDADAIGWLRQIIAAQREIQKLMRWPDEELARLKERELVATSTDYSRRGRL